MAISIAHLGPTGTYAEAAALAYSSWLAQQRDQQCWLSPYPSITQTLHSVAQGEADLAVVPVENSIEGSVAITLDTLWQLDKLQVQQGLVLPISHALLSGESSWETIRTVYSHPQALAQCRGWLEQFLPSVELSPTQSSAEALQYLAGDAHAAAIASPRASQLYDLSILASEINDYPDNCTRFWVLGLQPSTNGSHISLAFSMPANMPGSLAKPLSVFAQRGINLSRIESRPTKRSLGEYLFFIDLEGDTNQPSVQAALEELPGYTEILKIFGNYSTLTIPLPDN